MQLLLLLFFYIVFEFRLAVCFLLFYIKKHILYMFTWTLYIPFTFPGMYKEFVYSLIMNLYVNSLTSRSFQNLHICMLVQFCIENLNYLHKNLRHFVEGKSICLSGLVE